MKMMRQFTALALSIATFFSPATLSGLASTGGWETNLKDVASTANMPATLTQDTNGLCVSGKSGVDALAISKTRTDGNFIFESDVTFIGGNVANLIFGAESNTTSENSLIFKLDRSNRGETKVFCFSSSKGFPTVASNNGGSFVLNKDRYHMKVVVMNGSLAVYVDDVMVCSSALPDDYADGYLGLGTAEHSAAIFQNTIYTDLFRRKLGSS